MKKLFRYLFTHTREASIILSVVCLLSGAIILALGIKLYGSDLSFLLLPTGILLLLLAALVIEKHPASPQKRTNIVNLTVAILLSVALAIQPSSANELPEPERVPDNSDRVVLIVAIIGVGCLIGIGYAAYKLWHWADRYMPKVTKPPPPPPPVATNAPRAALNMPIMGTFTTTNQSIWDVSAFATNAAWMDPDGNPFNYFFTNRVEASTSLDFAAAEPITVFGWISTNWLETVLYIGQNMQPVVTNLSPHEVVPVLQSGLPFSSSYFIK